MGEVGFVPSMRWPGSGTAHLGYGTPGAVSADKHGEIITARQHIIGGIVNGGTSSLVPPILRRAGPLYEANLKPSRIKPFVSRHLLGGIPAEMLQSLSYESLSLESPAALDLDMGVKIAATQTGIVYGEDTYVKEWRENEETNYLDMKSPVMQVDGHNLIRTKRGLAIGAEYFEPGEFMSAATMSPTTVLATTKEGEMLLIDVENRKPVWQNTQPKGSLGAWSQVQKVNEQLSVWTNRYTTMLIDHRAPPQQASRTLIDYLDRQREIRAIGVSAGGDIFALSSYEFLWLDNDGPVITLEHPIARNDWSASMHVGRSRDNILVSVSSQISPLCTAVFFGFESSGLPVLKDDLYYLESWPTIAAQSHITLETNNGFAIYSVGNGGGLFKQHWVETGSTQRDALTDLPPVDNCDDPPSARHPFAFEVDGRWYPPFDQGGHKPPTQSVNFTKLYADAFEEDDREEDMAREDCEELQASWVDQCLVPQVGRLSASAQSRVRSQIGKMARSVSEAMGNKQPVITRPNSQLRLPKDVRKTLASWKDEDLGELDPPSESSQLSQSVSQPTSSQPALSQPTLSQPTLSQPALSQPTLSHPTLSQPALSTQARKHKHKRRKQKHI